ncbi:helix-turn-helix domain-containing protein [Providencia sneebia]|uniref:Fimbrial operon regulator n=1 Tax=Providencia sneebia DSM 19967 TaxID=1141660 RepID=K8WIF6_9GAMM|nr:helix-turn-helix transcriptional regulator [Providencia sneebia]EKT56000.1 fimbrial operon regulator [Providencia sneebia DSM 19967]
MGISKNTMNQQSADTDIIAKMIGVEIYRLRKARAMTGTQLAKKLNLSQQQISRYECGVCHIGIETLILILNFFNISISDFFQRVYVSALDVKEAHSILKYYKVMLPLSEDKILKTINEKDNVVNGN